METRYAYVARRIVEDIASGKYPVGAILPTEFELASIFGVSRSTVRAAMRELESLGLVSRRRNTGTRVEAASPQDDLRDFTHTLTTIEELQQFGQETRRLIRSVDDVVADDGLAEALGCRPGSSWLKVSFLRHAPGAPPKPPICWTDVFIDSSFSDAVRERVETFTGIYGSLLEEVSGRRITEIHQTIRAVGVPERAAEALQVKPDSHALQFRRRYTLSPGSLAEVSLSVHPAERFSYEMRLRRKQSARQ